MCDYGGADDWAKQSWSTLAFTGKGLTDIQALYLYRLRVITNATTSLDDYAIMGHGCVDHTGLLPRGSGDDCWNKA